MTPGARVQAAIEVLDQVLRGAAAERALTAWARGARYAGSKDRAAVRDHVFDALRRLRSAAWAGGQGDVAPSGMSARAVMAGLLAGLGADLAALFDGQGHAPAPLDPLPDPGPAPAGVRLDLPDWLLPLFTDALGPDAEAVALALRDRAPVILRANTARIDRDALVAALLSGGVAAAAHPLSPSAVLLAGAPRGLQGLPAFTEGLFEFQDAGSQALVDRLPFASGARILDLCAGGGGKALAYAARSGEPVHVHDADPSRMRDLPARAARAGADLRPCPDPEAVAPFDGIIADVPCSGSGSWRRAPEAKWRLTPDRLSDLQATQDAILDRARSLLRPGGWIGYMTCSLLASENDDRVAAASRRHGDLQCDATWRCMPRDGADGFFLAILRRGQG
ncbi:RsmB/NOP family class I SAM-dependent RNA methyltransferase [Jannaschia ovalis]|uniref:RsmB/NOP family class I SAM-dependent RNA methyltransferase n=1 Tax=Jannaschia ovalis TaxID=3038773 RepID=A0ABY8LET6_9RHOB|nr:RsmB/NOP family class I SAM-dependent RNA methyltransferase [Jannaschia sp. GRR-S6-38]WGH78825.1 RsmB/NOP family class I SAM-dependent RNA methyltransferase [Jannaschia sp. GRR-S6-38]